MKTYTLVLTDTKSGAAHEFGQIRVASLDALWTAIRIAASGNVAKAAPADWIDALYRGKRVATVPISR